MISGKFHPYIRLLHKKICDGSHRIEEWYSVFPEPITKRSKKAAENKDF